MKKRKKIVSSLLFNDNRQFDDHEY